MSHFFKYHDFPESPTTPEFSKVPFFPNIMIFRNFWLPPSFSHVPFTSNFMTFRNVDVCIYAYDLIWFSYNFIWFSSHFTWFSYDFIWFTSDFMWFSYDSIWFTMSIIINIIIIIILMFNIIIIFFLEMGPNFSNVLFFWYQHVFRISRPQRVFQMSYFSFAVFGRFWIISDTFDPGTWILRLQGQKNQILATNCKNWPKMFFRNSPRTI